MIKYTLVTNFKSLINKGRGFLVNAVMDRRMTIVVFPPQQEGSTKADLL